MNPEWTMKLLLDCDGVVFGFHTHVSDILGLSKKYADFKSREITDDLDEREKKLYYELMATPEFWGTLPLLDKTAPAIVKAARKADHRIRWSTSPWTSCKEWGFMRYSLLREHFDAHPRDVHIGTAKEDIAADVFIDDLVENVEKWQQEHPMGLAYVFEAPYNEKDGKAFQRINWKGIAKMLGVLL
jgi:5'(3')-deoxyribonucleotidase